MDFIFSTHHDTILLECHGSMFECLDQKIVKAVALR